MLSFLGARGRSLMSLKPMAGTILLLSYFSGFSVGWATGTHLWDLEAAGFMASGSCCWILALSLRNGECGRPRITLWQGSAPRCSPCGLIPTPCSGCCQESHLRDGGNQSGGGLCGTPSQCYHSSRIAPFSKNGTSISRIAEIRGENGSEVQASSGRGWDGTPGAAALSLVAFINPRMELRFHLAQFPARNSYLVHNEQNVPIRGHALWCGG